LAPSGALPVDRTFNVLTDTEAVMAKGYWVVSYRKVLDPEALAAYSKLATAAIQAAGGRIIVRGMAVFAHEAGIKERTVVVEFDSVESAISTFNSEAYKAALAALGTAVERDFRIVEGAD
jgi:uncharacterized protein (DUF1330 family)